MGIILVVSSVAPMPFPVVILWLYIGLLVFMVIAHVKKEKWVLYFVALTAQFVFAFMLFIYLLVNNWCAFYYYRYIVASPPGSYYASNTTAGAL